MMTRLLITLSLIVSLPFSSTFSLAKVSQAESLQAFHVSLEETNHLRLKGDKIINAIYDNSRLEIQTDHEAGELFILPRREGKTALYVLTESQQTIGLEIVTEDALAAQSLTIDVPERPRSTPEKNKKIAPFYASDYVAGLKRLVKNAHGSIEAPDMVETVFVPTAALKNALATLKPLRLKTARFWVTQGMSITRVKLLNPSLKKITIDPAALQNLGFLGLGLSASEARPGEALELIFLEVRDDV